MRYTIIILGGMFVGAVPTAGAADQASKEESIGVGVGLTVGAVAGGPVGAILGAAVGAKLGDSYHRQDAQIGELEASLEDSNTQVSRLQETVAGLNADIGQLERNSRPELLALLRAGIEMELLFRTDEHVLSDGTGRRIGELARTLATMPEVRVRLDGYADERGDEQYNRRLSGRRAQHVRKLLVEHGIDGARITTAAHGESPADDDDADSYALERRVSMTLFVGETPSLAANPD